MSRTVIDELVALFKLDVDPSGVREAEGLLEGLANRTERLRTYQDRLAATMAVAGGVIAYSWWQANTEYESLRNSLDLVTGSATETARAMAFLEEFARSSPDQLGQLTAAYQMLLAQGLDPTTERMTRLGDAAAAVGTDMATLIDAATGGVIGNTERLDELFGRFGLNFSSRQGVLYAQIGDANERVGDSFAEIAAFIENLGETRFAGGMVRQAQTLEGAVSMVQDAWNQLMVSIGSGGLREEVQELVRAFADVLTEARPAGRELGGYLLIAVRLLSMGMTTLAENGDAVRAALLALAALGQGAAFVGLVNMLRQLGLLGAIIAAEAVAVPLAVGLMVGAAMLLVEDFYQWMSGGKSVIGEFVDQFVSESGATGDVARFFQDLKTNGGEALQLLLADLRSIWTMTTGWTDAFVTGIDSVIAKITGLREQLLNLFPPEVRWLIERAMSAGGSVLSGAANMVPGVAGARMLYGAGRSTITNGLAVGRSLATGETGGALADAIMYLGEAARNDRQRLDENGNPLPVPAWWGMGPASVSTPPPAPSPARTQTLTIQGTKIDVIIPAGIGSEAELSEWARRTMPDLIADSMALAAERAGAELE